MNTLFSIDNRFDCQKIPLLFYVIFDWLKGHQANIVQLIEAKFDLKVLKPPIIENKRKIKDCFHLLVTQQLNNTRKNINEALNKNIKIKCYLKRDIKQERLDNPGKTIKYTLRNMFCLYPWMIRGDFVSKNIYVYSLLLNR
jgi:hypothetical protein